MAAIYFWADGPASICWMMLDDGDFARGRGFQLAQAGEGDGGLFVENLLLPHLAVAAEAR
jgi:hypothetical protein